MALPNMDLSLLWMPSNESSRVVIYIGVIKSMWYLASGFQGAGMVMEEGHGGRGLAGDSCMEIVVHAPLTQHT